MALVKQKSPIVPELTLNSTVSLSAVFNLLSIKSKFVSSEITFMKLFKKPEGTQRSPERGV